MSVPVRQTFGRWTILNLCSGLLFALVLCIARWFPQYLIAIDEQAEGLVRPLQTFGLSEPFLVVTVLGSGIGITALALGSTYFLRQRPVVVWQLALLLLGSSLSMTFAKAFVERTRPQVLDWLVSLHSYSFPSGHATLSTAFYGFMAVVLYRLSTTRTTRLLSVLVPSLLILSVCVSRIVLGYHYLTDVVAGVVLGLFWLSLVLTLPEPRGWNSRKEKEGRVRD